jgi:hypothetical protein
VLTRGRPAVIPPESVLMFRVDDALTINTTASQVAFQPVTQDDYNNRQNDGPRRMRPAYGYPGPGYGYPPPPPPSAYYYSPYYAPYPAYGFPLPLTFGFGWGFGYGHRFGGFRR